MTNEQYYDCIQPYQNACQIMRAKLEVLNGSLYQKSSVSPIHNIQERIKAKKSIEKKLEKLGHSDSVQNAKDYLRDIAGIRVICYFIDDIYNLVNALKRQSELIFIREKDYIKNPKPNGYRSFHVIIAVPVYYLDTMEYFPVEIQLRTMTMDLWASMEHRVCYKKLLEHREEYGIRKALDILNTETIDLLIIDIMMPRLDGIRATVKIRESNPLPIIILSAKSEDTDKILGLNIGADDYITKPFNPLELIARVKSQLRRYTQLGAAAPTPSEHIYTTGGLTVNDDKKEVLVDGEPVRLTPIEYNILLLLMKNQGRVFSTTQIYESIWNEDALAADNTVAVHVRHIREKIEINPREPRYLKVVWGLGYKIEKLSR